MSYSFEDIWSLSVSELERRRKQTAYEYGTLYNKFIRLDSLLKDRRQKLSNLNSEVALVDRQIKDNRNNNFILNKKRREMGDALALLKGAVEKKEAVLSELNSSKSKLESRINELNHKILEASRELADSAKINNINKKKIVELQKEKKTLSAEISKFLSETDIERDEFERKAQELNNTFVMSLTLRSGVKNRLSSIQKEIQQTLESIDMFKNQIENVKEIQKLRQEIPEIAKEQRSLGVKYAELQIELLNKQEEFDSINSMVETQQKQLSSISDDNLIKIDSALTALNEHKIAVQTLSQERSKALDQILDIMIEKVSLEENQGVIWQRVEKLEAGILEFARDNV
ncbi:MAG: hypothetical protein HQK72_05330 [Desulfamplus sp.]|nr:hypothetical protein [Desulfamplus sp.]